MSLMNDALRKKKGEDSNAKPAPATALIRGKGKDRKQRIILMALVGLGGALFFSFALWPLAQDHNFNTSSIASERRPAGAADDHPPPGAAPEAIAGEQGQTAGQPPADHSATTDRTMPVIVPVSGSGPSLSAPSKSQPPHPTPTTMVQQATASLTEGMLTGPATMPLEGSHSSLAETPSQALGTTEPDPDRAVPSVSPKPDLSGRTTRPVPAAQAVTPSATAAMDSANMNTTPALANADQFYQRALACHRGGRLVEAGRFYRGALDINADHHGAMLNLAAVYIEKGQFNQARPLLQRLEKMSPRPDGVLLNLAITALGNDQPQVALAHLDQAEATANAPLWQIAFHRAAALTRLNRLTDAVTLYQQVEVLRPDDHRVKFNLAVIFDTLEEYTKALYYYDAVLKAPAQASPNDRQSIARRAVLLRRFIDTTHSQATRQ